MHISGQIPKWKNVPRNLHHLRSIKAITLPVLPPTFPNAFPSPLAAPAIAGPADDVTRERPWVAFDWKSEALCCTFEAVSLVASVALVEVDSNLRDVRPASLVDCRSTAREMGNDMVNLGASQQKERDSLVGRVGYYRAIGREL
jgi:hypothetical protein